ncbi:hypothetical protein bAD24_p00160 (plasmid) [Burkholderia sp. AD24]|nr:hypothetical protein bAD24_p00160 [Burkholderia sp. AD24]
MFVAFPVAFAIDKTVHLDVVGGSLLLLLEAACAWCLSIPIRAYLNAGAWFDVDEKGFRYGVGRQRGDERAVVETRVAWRDVVCNPLLRYDVTTDFTGRQSLVKELRFWRRLPSGEIVLDEIPLRLTPDIFRCLRFRNRTELMNAVMQGLATQPELRFHGHVFVDIGIDPETWQPMRGPRRIETAAASLIGVAVWIFIWKMIGIWPTWLVVTIGIVATLAICAVLAGRSARAHPMLDGVIGFVRTRGTFDKAREVTG